MSNEELARYCTTTANLSSENDCNIVAEDIRDKVRRKKSETKFSFNFVLDKHYNLKDELIEQTINLKIDNLVFFVPSVKNLSIPLAVMDIFVMPSLQEGLGLSIMEAQARGVPVVASNVGGIPELVQNEETGLLVPSADVVALAKSIKYLLENESVALSMAEKAKNNIQSKFSIRLMADKTETFYRMALEGIS